MIKRGVARYNSQTGKWEWGRAAEKIEILKPVRRFPPPWSVEKQAACYVVRDHGQALAYVYFEDELGRLFRPHG
jgi:hypothetical protein